MKILFNRSVPNYDATSIQILPHEYSQCALKECVRENVLQPRASTHSHSKWTQGSNEHQTQIKIFYYFMIFTQLAIVYFNHICRRLADDRGLVYNKPRDIK